LLVESLLAFAKACMPCYGKESSADYRQHYQLPLKAVPACGVKATAIFL